MAKWPTPTVPMPTEDEVAEDLQRHVMDSGSPRFECSDGCEIEADGVCSHGHPTWLVRAGLI